MDRIAFYFIMNEVIYLVCSFLRNGIDCNSVVVKINSLNNYLTSLTTHHSNLLFELLLIMGLDEVNLLDLNEILRFQQLLSEQDQKKQEEEEM